MEAIFGAIHGAYAYLLIFQILVVTLLFLTLLWLVVKRTKEGAIYLGAEKAAPNEVAASVSAEAPQAAYAAVGAEATASAPAPAAAGEAAPASDTEKTALAEKVKFLESKLLEYEILQEEIGALGALKSENEKLKSRLVAFESGSPPPPEAAAPAAEAPAQSPKELARQLASAFDGNAVFTENPPAATTAPVKEEAAPAPAPTEPLPEAKKQPDLDDLLSQIDSLTADKH